MFTYAQMASAMGFPSPIYIARVIDKWGPDEKQHIFSQEMPTENHPFSLVQWVEREQMSGLMPPHVVDAAPFLRNKLGFTDKAVKTINWAESWRLRQSDFERIRAEMAYNKLAGKDAVMKESRLTDLRMYGRLEWCRVQALKGTLTVNEMGVIRTIQYPLLSGNNPTPSTLWSDTANADPLKNITAWAKNFRGVGGRKIRCYYNLNVATMLSENAKLLAHFSGTNMVGELSAQNVGSLLSKLVKGTREIEFILYDEGYLQKESDDSFTFIPFLDDNDFLMVCDPPNGQQLGAFFTTPDIRGAKGNSFVPMPGKWTVVENELQSKLPYYEQSQGINGIPVIFHPECRLLGTVAA